MTLRHRIGTAMFVLLPVALFGGLMLAGESAAFLVLGFIFAFGAGWVGSKLQEPRDRAVSNLAETILRKGVNGVDVQQQEYEAFYLTTDWRELRRLAIERDGNVCGGCNESIQNPFDITVDHIKPRSKFPELALVLSNLRVLCRGCNSRKGNR